MSASGAKHARVLGVLGGASLSPSLLASWANSATFVVAADGGADALLAEGVTPHVVVGDLDSLVADRSRFPDVREDSSHAYTDCDKLLALLRGEGYTEVTLINAAGELPDHELAVLHSAARSGLHCRLVYERGFGHILVGPITRAVSAEGRVSLIPLTACTGVSLRGVRWELGCVELDPLGATSISNEATTSVIEAGLESGVAFFFIEAQPAPSWPA